MNLNFGETAIDDFVESLDTTETLAAVLLAVKCFLTEPDAQKHQTKDGLIDSINVVLNKALETGVLNKFIEAGYITRHPTIH